MSSLAAVACSTRWCESAVRQSPTAWLAALSLGTQTCQITKAILRRLKILDHYGRGC